jgi:L-ascorbate metabolism protein UlaG (beta-lactamase superfamily)
MALTDSTRIRFFGVAAYEVVTRSGKRVLMDPFLSGNPGAPVTYDSFDKVDLVIVSHAARDHLGDTEAIARRYGCPVVCGGEVRAYLKAKGIPVSQIMVTTWGIKIEVAGLVVQPLECHHWSQIEMPDGAFASGVPMAFILYADEGVRFYHYGDTAIFSDLKLQGSCIVPRSAVSASPIRKSCFRR